MKEDIGFIKSKIDGLLADGWHLRECGRTRHALENARSAMYWLGKFWALGDVSSERSHGRDSGDYWSRMEEAMNLFGSIVDEMTSTSNP